jgi:hypothetical protein
MICDNVYIRYKGKEKKTYKRELCDELKTKQRAKRGQIRLTVQISKPSE